MNCPYCNQDSKVTNSRLQKRANSVWRRRECFNCGAIWTTIESMKGSVTYKVMSDESLVDFRSELLLISLYEALKHRKSPELDAQYIYGTVLGNLQNTNEPIFTTTMISEQSYKVLKNYDKLAAELYKAIHKV